MPRRPPDEELPPEALEAAAPEAEEGSDDAPAEAEPPAPRDADAPSPEPEAPASRAARWTLRILQAGLVLAVLVSLPLPSFDLDRFFVPKELVLHLTALLAGLTALPLLRRVRPTRADVLLWAFVLVSAVSVAFSTNVWAGLRALAVTTSGVAVFYAARGVRRAGLGRPLLATLAAAVVLAALTAMAQAYGLTTDFFSENRAPGGTLGNRNFVGHLAAFGLPLLLLYVLRARRLPAVFAGAGGAVLVAGVLVLTRSRAAWLAAAVVVVVVLAGLLLSPAARRSAAVWARLALVLALAAGGGALSLLLPNALTWRSDTPYLETARGVVNYRDGSGQGRLVQYRRSVAMTLRHPVLGVGPGNWPVVYPAFAARNDPSMMRSVAGTTANPWPSSDWVAMLSERGLVGWLLLAGFFASLAAMAWRLFRRAVTSSEALAGLMLLALLAAVVTAGLFDAVLLLAWPSLIFFAAAGLLFAQAEAAPARVPRWALPVGVLLLSLLGGAFAVRSGGQVAAMALYEADAGNEALARAARLDPGNYRVHLRLAQRTRGAQRCRHAKAAAALFPEAHAAAALARGCP